MNNYFDRKSANVREKMAVIVSASEFVAGGVQFGAFQFQFLHFRARGVDFPPLKL
jgi:hypothetical protein